MKEDQAHAVGETVGNILGLVLILTLATTYVANIVGTIRGDINTWLGVIGMFIPPVGWFSGLAYLL